LKKKKVDGLRRQPWQEDRKSTNLVNITIDIKYQGAVFNDYIYIKAVTFRESELKKKEYQVLLSELL
jgi:hypothetical protein